MVTTGRLTEATAWMFPGQKRTLEVKAKVHRKLSCQKNTQSRLGTLTEQDRAIIEYRRGSTGLLGFSLCL
jgi:hypothetical protein